MKLNFTFIVAAHLAIAGLFSMRPARAADPGADPFAEHPPAVPESNVAQPSQQAPASAPAGSSANFPTGLVERLPSSAYPEPVIRGLYGSSLWLDMQGYQWPYYPRIGVGVSGYGWVDTQYKYTRVGDPGQSAHNTKLFAQGRFNLRLTPTYTNGSWFVQAQAEIIGNLNQLGVQANLVDTDDLWVRTGVWKQWDITVGRFEAFPVYHLGMGLDLNTDERVGAYDGVHGAGDVPQAYLASYMYYRPRGPENAAVHLYFLDQRLRIEGLVQWGSENILSAVGDVVPVNVLGARGAAIFDLGWIKFRYAHEYQWKFPPDPATATHNEYRNRGGAGSIQFLFAPWIEFGPNFGKAITDVFVQDTIQPGSSGDVLSYGGFLNVRPVDGVLIGTGANYASFTNLHNNAATNANDKSTNTQYFVALQYLVNQQLFVKLVGGYAKTRFDFSFNGMAPYEDDMFSVRLRLMYLY